MAQESLTILIQGPTLKGPLKYTVHSKNYFRVLTTKEAWAIENQTSWFWPAISLEFTERTDRDLSDLIKGNISQLNKCLFYLKDTYHFVLIKIRFYIVQVNPALKDFQIWKSILMVKYTNYYITVFYSDSLQSLIVKKQKYFLTF